MGVVKNFPDGAEVPQDFLSEQVKEQIQILLKNGQSGQELRDNRELFFYILSIPNGATKTNAIAELKRVATEPAGRYRFKSREFDTLFNSYKEDFLKHRAMRQQGPGGAVTQFTGQPIELCCGNWAATDAGVWKTVDRDGNQQETACSHPLTIEKILVNRQTRHQKVVLAYKLHDKWESTIQERSLIANSQAIIGLSSIGLDVTSENAKDLVSYLRTLINSNTGRIPVGECTSNLGWVDGVENGFIPFNGKVEFDGDSSYQKMFESIREKGDYGVWLAHMQEIRKDIYVRIVTSAGFASILVRPLGLLPFIVHLHGKASGGKTVAQMAAASIWGNPERGDYMQIMKSTPNYSQRISVVLRDLPLVADELQTIKKSATFENYDKFIYSITEGVDKGRANAAGGVDSIGVWSNAFIFSGEEPITTENSGGGAKNRVIEMDLSNTQIIADGNGTSNLFRKNYGFAGPMFIDLVRDGLGCIEKTYKSVFEECRAITDEKQAMAVAAIITADELVAREMFKEAPLSLSDYESFLRDKAESSIAERAYKWLVDTIAANEIRFLPTLKGNHGEIWGKFDGKSKPKKDAGGECGYSECFFIKSKLDEVMEKAGYNLKAVQKEWESNKYIEFYNKKPTQPTRIPGLTATPRCVKIMLFHPEPECETEVKHKNC